MAGGIVLDPRPGDVIGPSVQAFGVGEASTGTRADLLVCDDIVDVRALHSRAERQRVIDYFHENLMNLLEPDGRFWGLFTPWHRDDLNARLKVNGADDLFREAVGPDFEPVWEEKWPRERLRQRKEEVGSLSFARGYLLQPVAGEETTIRPAWVRYWSAAVPAAAGETPRLQYEQVILAVDPAVSTATSADRSAAGGAGEDWANPDREEGVEMWVACGSTPTVGVRPANEIHVLAARAARLAAPDLVALIDHLDHVWNPSVIVFESNAAFLGMRDLLARHARFGPKMKGVNQTADKAARIAAFSVVVENGVPPARRRARRWMRRSELFEEMIGFPFVDLDDLVDAAATGTQYLLTQREPWLGNREW